MNTQNVGMEVAQREPSAFELSVLREEGIMIPEGSSNVPKAIRDTLKVKLERSLGKVPSRKELDGEFKRVNDKLKPAIVLMVDEAKTNKWDEQIKSLKTFADGTRGFTISYREPTKKGEKKGSKESIFSGMVRTLFTQLSTFDANGKRVVKKEFFAACRSVGMKQEAIDNYVNGFLMEDLVKATESLKKGSVEVESTSSTVEGEAFSDADLAATLG